MPQRHFILTFHGIGEPPPTVPDGERRFWVAREVLEATLDQVATRSDVSVTFDDGNRSDADIALPALVKRGLSARFFVLSDRLEQPGYLDADDLRVLAAAGMSVGCHGVGHRPWTGLDTNELRDELDAARSLLEDAVGAPVTEASCPFGIYDRRVLRQLRSMGFERVYTSDGGRTDPNAWLQARNTVEAGWEPTPERLSGREPASTRLVRRAKQIVKRWR